MDNPFTAAPAFAFTNLNVNPFLAQPSPLGGRTGLGTRMYHSALRTVGGVTHLVAEHSPGFSDPSGTRSKVHWYDITVTNPAWPGLLQQGKIAPGPGIATWFPDAALAPDGTIGLNYSQSVPFGSALPRPGIMDMYVTGRRPSDAPGTMQPPLVAKLGTATLNAFGRARDYSFTTVDPVHGSVWGADEYSASLAAPNWATWIQHWSLGLGVVSTSPAVGSTVATRPTSYQVTFSEAIDPTSLQPTDFQVNTNNATTASLSPDHKTATFTFTTDPIATEGLQTMTVPANAVFKEGDSGTTNQAFSGQFRYDTVALQVTSTNPPFPGGVFTLPGPFTYDVTFNEALDPASVQASDLVLSGIAGAAATGVTVLPDNTTPRFPIGGI